MPDAVVVQSQQHEVDVVQYSLVAATPWKKRAAIAATREAKPPTYAGLLYVAFDRRFELREQRLVSGPDGLTS